MDEQKEGEVKHEPNEENVSRGRKSRAAGARFELQVRKHLEEKGWITDKWTKNVDLEKKELVAARRKFIPGKGFMGIGTGFPDFIAFRQVLDKNDSERFYNYHVIAVESKMNGTLQKVEKEKCQHLLDNKVFKNILVARKGEKRGSIEFVDFVTKEIVNVF